LIEHGKFPQAASRPYYGVAPEEKTFALDKAFEFTSSSFFAFF
jgi:hypothetical protein